MKNVRDVASCISPNVVFSNPTLTGLANELVNLISGKASMADPKEEIERMIEKYSIGLQDICTEQEIEGKYQCSQTTIWL